MCFNPLPARVRGEMILLDEMVPFYIVSIRSPRGCAGRSFGLTRPGVNQAVSIRSPRGCAGRSGSAMPTRWPLLFQSAPRAGARGDKMFATALSLPLRFNPLPARVRGEITRWSGTCQYSTVSIRSPRGCAGRSGSAMPTRWPLLFQSAPRAGARGDKMFATALSLPLRFNPLPARVRGEIEVRLQVRVG